MTFTALQPSIRYKPKHNNSCINCTEGLEKRTVIRDSTLLYNRQGFCRNRRLLEVICFGIVMNLPAERGWVSKNLPQGPRAPAEGQVFTDPPKLCWEVHHSCSSNRMLEQFTVKSYQLCGTEIRWRTEQLSVGVTRMPKPLSLGC